MPGSTIMTDCWAGYKNLQAIFPEYCYAHLTVNHSRNFVDPVTGAHTQTIEAFWSVIKGRMQTQKLNRESLDKVYCKISEGLYKKQYENVIFETILHHIPNFY